MKKYFVLLFAPVMLWGCEKTMPNEGEGINSPEESTIIDDTPYPIEIMRQAVGEVMGKTRGEASELTPTHRYIEFVPATFEEYYRLLGSEEIDCAPGAAFDPVEIPEGNDHFTAVREEGEGPEKLYALIESNVALPDGIACNVLGEYYTPYAVGIEPEVSQRVAARAAVLAGVVTTDVAEPTFTPHGTIKMYDDLLMLGRPRTAVPLANLEIMIQETRYIGGIPLYFLEYIRTDENGYFTSKKSYTRGQLQNLSFSLLWKQGTVSITDASGNLGQTWGKCDTYGAWNFTIDPSSIGQSRMTFYYAVLFRAVNVAVNEGADVLDFLGHYVQLRVNQMSVSTSSPGLFLPKQSTGIYPFAGVDCFEVDGYDIMYRALYMLGLISKYVNHHESYVNGWTVETLKQGWGAFVGYYFMDKEAERVGGNPHELMNYQGKIVQRPDGYNKQNWSCGHLNNTAYTTPVFIDLYDDFNQYEYYNFLYPMSDNKNRPNDNICISDFKEIYKIAMYTAGIATIHDYIRVWMGRYGQYGCSTENFEHFFSVWTYGKYVQKNW